MQKTNIRWYKYGKEFIIFLLLIGILVFSQYGFCQNTADLFRMVDVGSQSNSEGLMTGKGFVSVYTWFLGMDDTVTESSHVMNVIFQNNFFRAEKTSLLMVADAGDEVNYFLSPPGTVERELLLYTVNSALSYNPDLKAAVFLKDNWDGPLLTFAVSVKPKTFGFDHIISNNDYQETITKEIVDGQEIIKLEQIIISKETPNHEIFKLVYLIDHKKGFTPLRIQRYVKDDNHPDFTLCEEYINITREYMPGIWGPKECSHISYKLGPNGKLRKTIVVTSKYSKGFKFGIPVDSKELSVTLPVGTQVTDRELKETKTLTEETVIK